MHSTLVIPACIIIQKSIFASGGAKSLIAREFFFNVLLPKELQEGLMSKIDCLNVLLPKDKLIHMTSEIYFNNEWS